LILFANGSFPDGFCYVEMNRLPFMKGSRFVLQTGVLKLTVSAVLIRTPGGQQLLQSVFVLSLSALPKLNPLSPASVPTADKES
jgi:hypothetical protein